MGKKKKKSENNNNGNDSDSSNNSFVPYAAGVIKEIRKSHGLTQEEFADKIGCSVAHAGAIERGESAMSFELMGSMVYAFCLDANIFFESRNIRYEVGEGQFAAVLRGMNEMRRQNVLHLIKDTSELIEQSEGLDDEGRAL